MSIAAATTSIWADSNMIGAIIGSSVGLFGGIIGCWGACIGAFAPKGKHRAQVIGAGYLFTAVGVLILAGGVVMLTQGAVSALWLGTMLAGFTIAGLTAMLTVVAKRRYAQSEERILSAESLRRD